MKIKIFITIFAAFLLSFVFSCSPKVSIKDEYIDYEDILERNTKIGKDYEDLETRLIVYATYKDIALAESQIKKTGRDLHYDIQKVNMMLLKAQREDEFFINFFVAAYFPDERYADLSKKREFWRVFIKKGNYELIEARAINKVPKSKLAEYEIYYPYITNWMDCYEVIFSRNSLFMSTGTKELERPFSLVIAGQIGNLEIIFD